MSCRIDLYNGTRYKWGKTYSDSDKMEWEWPDVVQPYTHASTVISKGSANYGYRGSVQYRFIGPEDARHSFRIIVEEGGGPVQIINESVASRSLSQGGVINFKWINTSRWISVVDDATSTSAVPGLYHTFLVG